jgi:hypothetical protein
VILEAMKVVIMSVTTFIASSITGHPIRLTVIMSVTTFIVSSITGHPIRLSLLQRVLIGRPVILEAMKVVIDIITASLIG